LTAGRSWVNVPAVGNAFAETATVESTGPGRYRAALDERWNLRPLPQGGILSAIAVRAMEAELAHDEQSPRLLHTTFAAQVAHGPLEVEVEVLRVGRSMSQLRAEVRNPGTARGHLTTCVFGAPRVGFEFSDLRPPESVPKPEDCRSFRDPPPEGAPVFEQMPFWTELVEGRPVIGHAPWDDYVPDRAERAMWYRFDESPVLDDGRLDPLALIVFADSMPGAVGEMVGRNDRSWFAPSVDLTVHFLDDCRSSWVLAHNRARFAGDGYASADMALWDCGDDGGQRPRLVAYATQMFLFTFPDGP
jgi:acyl-CoA thioesterase